MVGISNYPKIISANNFEIMHEDILQEAISNLIMFQDLHHVKLEADLLEKCQVLRSNAQ